MASTNRRSRNRFGEVLRELRGVRDNIDAAEVDPSAHTELTEGAQRFLVKWDDCLGANASRVATMMDGLRGLRPSFGRFDELLAAAVDTARLRHTRVFDRLRTHMLSRVQSEAERFQSKMETVMATSDADRALVALLNEDQEAQAIVKAVNVKYPKGYLAELVSE